MTTRQSIIEILSLVLQREYALDQEVSRDTEERWDSLKHVEIIFALEDAFSVTFSEEDMTRMINVTAIAACLENHNAT